MSAISGAGVWSHRGSHWHRGGVGAVSSATDLTASSISGSITGTVGAIATSRGPKLKQIEAAVTKALQTKGPTADANGIVQRAIETALKNPTTDAAGDGRAADDGTHQLFVQTLAAYGITPKQFNDDLLAAMQKVQGGTPGGTSTTSSFPAGVFLDASA